MIKKIFIFSILTLSLVSSSRVLQSLRVLSANCNFHGYEYKNRCFCQPQWSGLKCDTPVKSVGYADLDTLCDDLKTRLDYLANISPNNYNGEDNEFPRLSGNSIGEGTAAYGDKGNSWIKMHDLAKDFRIFGDSIEPRDIRQGALGNCYALAGFAALAIFRNGEILKSIFETTTDNDKHVYVTRWMVEGKPRYVAVDEWVPGKEGVPSFSKVTGDHDFWAIILEKAWAKIHGSYMATEYGWHTEVWKALTQAPIGDLWHEGHSKEEIFNKIKSLLAKGYPVGAATSAAPDTREVQSHAYAVLGTYEVTKPDGTKEKLVKLHNPWSSEVWEENPWGDDSKLWTAQNKREAENTYSGNDGVFYNSLSDFVQNFGITNWAEYDPTYDVSYIDIALKKNQIKYDAQFKVQGNKGQTVNVFIHLPETRIIKNCQSPFSINSLQVKGPNGVIYEKDGDSVKIPNALEGVYTVLTEVENYKVYNRDFTITTYGPKDSVTFLDKKDNNIDISEEIKCPNDCSINGKCNKFNGNCKCYEGFMGYDCSQKYQPNVTPKPNPKPLPKKCVDLDTRCPEWTKEGECESEPNKFKRMCKISCNSCEDNQDPKCQDRNPQCSKWAATGLCEQKKDYMIHYCRRSCYFCNKPEPIIEPKDCVNKHTGCKQWAERGECDANPTYMRVNCRPACKEDCKEGTPEPVPEPIEDPNCQDDYDTNKCKGWNEAGECDNNPIWMKANCRLSCKVCKLPGPNPKPEPQPKPEPKPKPEPNPEECVDRNENCEGYKQSGYCEDKKAIESMKYYCFKTCGFCKNPEPKPQPNCKDLNENCKAYKDAGYCTDHKDTMQHWCPFTCNLCN